jgi:hypothetical protein
MADNTLLQNDILQVMQTAFPVILAQELPGLLQQYVPPILEREVPIIIDRIVPTILDREVPAIINREVPAIIKSEVPAIINREVPAIIKSEVPAIVKAETDDIREEVYRLDVLYEDLDNRFRADRKLLRDNLKVKDQVDDHEIRLRTVEDTNQLLKGVVREHSKQLKPKAA